MQVDVLVSGFLYHRRNPEDEQWLFEPVKAGPGAALFPLITVWEKSASGIISLIYNEPWQTLKTFPTCTFLHGIMYVIFISDNRVVDMMF